MRYLALVLLLVAPSLAQEANGLAHCHELLHRVNDHGLVERLHKPELGQADFDNERLMVLYCLFSKVPAGADHQTNKQAIADGLQIASAIAVEEESRTSRTLYEAEIGKLEARIVELTASLGATTAQLEAERRVSTVLAARRQAQPILTFVPREETPKQLIFNFAQQPPPPLTLGTPKTSWNCVTQNQPNLVPTTITNCY